MKNNKQRIEELCAKVAQGEEGMKEKRQLIRLLKSNLPPDVIDSKLKAKLKTTIKEIQVRQQDDDYLSDEDEALDKELLPLLEQLLT